MEKEKGRFEQLIRFSCNETVFVVDDEKVNRAIMSGLVRRLGFQCEELASGSEAVAAFEKAGGSVAAIIMDINMPGMDGLEAVWRIRAMEAHKRHSCSCQDAVVPASAFPSQQRPQMSSAQMTWDAERHNTGDAEGLCCRCKASRTPIWAVSSSSLQEQAKSPAMQLIPPSSTGPPWKIAGFDAFVPKPFQPVQLVSMLSNRQSLKASEDHEVKNCCQENVSEAVSEETIVPLCKLDACTQASDEVCCEKPASLSQVCTQAS